MEPNVPSKRLEVMTSLGLAVRSSVLGVLSLALLSACGGGQPQDVAPQSSAARGQSFSLYTHCGIDELRLDGKFYQRVAGPLDDGSGNTPKGWDNPYQAGWLSHDGNVVVFTDNSGHRERFELRAAATDYKHICA